MPSPNRCAKAIKEQQMKDFRSHQDRLDQIQAAMYNGTTLSFDKHGTPTYTFNETLLSIYKPTTTTTTSTVSEKVLSYPGCGMNRMMFKRASCKGIGIWGGSLWT